MASLQYPSITTAMQIDEALAGLQGYRRVIDDVVIYDQNKAEHGSRQAIPTEMC